MQLKIRYPTLVIQLKKTDFDAKISDIGSKYITTADYNRLTREIFDAKIEEKGLVDKSAVSEFINNTDWNKKVATLATKAQLKGDKMKDRMLKLQGFYSSCFRGKIHFK